MRLCWLTEEFSICKWNTDKKGLPDPGGVFFLGRTSQEVSLVCETARVPDHPDHREDGFCCFRIAGMLEFSLIGILAGLTQALALEGIGVFAVSTFDTDYILIRSHQRHKAQAVLEAAGYTFEGE